MQSKAATVAQYLKELPPERRWIVEAVRKVILAHLDAGFEEGMQYGMIGYYVPHRVYPPGYHCDSKQPLPFVNLAAQKNYYSLYMMHLYEGSEGEGWFRAAMKAAGKKLDMGKCCVRFKSLEDLPLELVGQAVGRTTAWQHIQHYESVVKDDLRRSRRRASSASAKKGSMRKK